MPPPFDNDSFSKAIGDNFARSVKGTDAAFRAVSMKWTAHGVVSRHASGAFRGFLSRLWHLSIVEQYLNKIDNARLFPEARDFPDKDRVLAR